MSLPAKTMTAPLPGALAEVQGLAKVFISSGLFADTKSEAQAIVKILAGKELGLGPFESMRDVNIIQGKTTLAGAQIAARIKKSGVYDYQVIQFDEKAARLQFTKNGKPLNPVIEFSIQDAQKLGLAGRDNYNKQARTMLFWRAVTMGARMHCPEVFGGSIYTPDEIKGGSPAVEEEVPATVVDAEYSQVEPEADPEPTVEAEFDPWSYRVEGNNSKRGISLHSIPDATLERMAQHETGEAVTLRDKANIQAALMNAAGRQAAIAKAKQPTKTAPGTKIIQEDDLPDSWEAENNEVAA